MLPNLKMVGLFAASPMAQLFPSVFAESRVVTVVHGGSLIARNWCTKRMVGGKIFWILGGSFMTVLTVEYWVGFSKIQ